MLHLELKTTKQAALLPNAGTGIGVIIRDENGKSLGARCKLFQHQYEIEVAEGIACLEGLLLAKELGGTNVTLESDCQTVIRGLETKREDLSYAGEIRRTILGETMHFDNVIYSWARRTANKVAYLLAQLAARDSNFKSYTGSCPDNIFVGIPMPERTMMV